jgi:DNA-binding XRE family transcriptional regulator
LRKGRGIEKPKGETQVTKAKKKKGAAKLMDEWYGKDPEYQKGRREARREIERDPDVKMARILRAVRKRINMPQVKLAQSLGVKQPRISQIERGAYDSLFETYINIFNAMGFAVQVRVFPTEELPNLKGEPKDEYGAVFSPENRVHS